MAAPTIWRTMMNFVTAVLAISVAGLLNEAVAVQDRQPDYKVQIWGDAVADFAIRVQAYSDLRTALERGLPPLRVTDDAKALLDREYTLAKRIREARARAKQGDIFTAAVTAPFKDKLQGQVNPTTCAALGDDNPGALAIPINGRYPEHKPASTMPADVLAVLPRLADDLEYRFVGRDLILLDLRSRLVIDRMPLAIQCSQAFTSG
jgi:hypothetical protein